MGGCINVRELQLQHHDALDYVSAPLCTELESIKISSPALTYLVAFECRKLVVRRPC